MRTTLPWIVALLVVGAGLVAPPVAAGDAIAIFEPAPEEQSAAAGETVALEIELASDGGYNDEGIDSYEFVVAVHPDVGEITDVEAGPWLAGDGGAVEQNVTRLEDGAVRIEQQRVGADDGQTGHDVAASVTVEIHEGAPAADAIVGVEDARSDLADSDFPMQTFGREATLVVDSGGDELQPQYGDDGEDADGGEDGGSDGVTTAEEVDREIEQEAESTDDESADESEADGLPGFGVAVALGALLATLALLRRRR